MFREIINYIEYGKINMYVVYNFLAGFLALFYNLANFKNNKKLLGKLSLYHIEYFSKRKSYKILSSPTFWTLFEIVTITIFQYTIPSAFTNIFGMFVGTGYNYFGMLFFGPIVTFAYFLLLSGNPLKKMDSITPAFPFALILVKYACYTAKCCGGFEWYGLHNQLSEPTQFPAQLVEMGAAFLIFIFLLFWKKRAKEGTMFPTYLIVYSAVRFCTEFFREEEDIIWKLKKYHIICIVGVIVGIAELIILKKYKEKILARYSESCYVAMDFINAVLIGLGIKDKNKIVHHGKKKNDKTVKNHSNAKFDTKKVRMWVLIWSLGLIGQIGWSVEGTWFNTYIYEKVDKNPSILTPMLILSAFATVLSVFFCGTHTDRTGKRRNLISLGYIGWGVLLMGFGFTNLITKQSLIFGIICIVILDMLISFFGSMSTDVGYSTWLTDIMDEKNQGQIGAAIAVQVVLGSMFGNIIGGKLIGPSNNYVRLFLVMGILLVLVGILSKSLFTRKDDVQPSIKGSYSQQLSVVFNPKKLLKQKEMLWVHIAIAVYFAGFNIYFPQLGNYIIDCLGYSPDQMGMIEAFPLIAAMLVTVPVSKHINNDRFFEITIFSIISGLAGGYLIYNIDPERVNTVSIFNIKLLLSIFLLGVGYAVMLQATKVWAKRLYPAENKGQYEALFAVAYGLIPMTFGSTIGERIIKTVGIASLNEFTGRYEYIPNGNIFLVGVIISSFSIIPILMTMKHNKKRKKDKQEVKQ